jgi:hypothetical protein
MSEVGLPSRSLGEGWRSDPVLAAVSAAIVQDARDTRATTCFLISTSSRVVAGIADPALVGSLALAGITDPSYKLDSCAFWAWIFSTELSRKRSIAR